MEESGGLASRLSCPAPLPAETPRPGPQTPQPGPQTPQPGPQTPQPGPQTPAHHDGPDGPDPDPSTDTLLPAGPRVPVRREPLKEEEDSGGSSGHTGSGGAGLGLGSGSGSGSAERACAQVAPHRTTAVDPLEQSAGPGAAMNPPGTAPETQTSTHLHQGVLPGANNGLHVDGGGGGGGGGGGISSVVGGCGGGNVAVLIQSLQPASLPVQRCPSDSETVQVEVCGHAPQGSAHPAQKAQGQVEVACKPSPLLQRRSVLAPAYHHDATRRPHCGSLHMCLARAGNASEDCVVMENHHHHHHLHHQHHQHHQQQQQQQQQQCEEPIRYANHGVLEDGFPACCLAQPLLAPAPQPLRVADPEAACQHRAGVPAHPDARPEAGLLAPPCLISSGGEAGLEPRCLLGCCRLDCSWAGPFPPPPGGFHAWSEECYRAAAAASRPISPVTAGHRTAAAAFVRDAGTMTVPREVRDVGVQASLATPPHVFPQVCLAEETGGGPPGAGRREGGGERGPGGVKRGSLKSPVKEVKWDAEGMTWEVYGASVDPEELGLAIQRHLELQIKETASRAAKLSRQGTATSRHSCAGAAGGRECGKKKVWVNLGSFRPPACCARTTTAVD